MPVSRRSALKLAIVCAMTLGHSVIAASVTDHGAIANDGKDDSAAIRSVIAAGGLVYFPGGGEYQIDSQVILPSGTRLEGWGVTLKAVKVIQGGVLLIAPGAKDISLYGLKIEAPGSHTILKSVGGLSNLSIRYCEFAGSLPNTNFLISIDAEADQVAQDIVVEDSLFRATRSCVELRDNINIATITRCKVSDWRTYGVLIRGGRDETGPDLVTVAYNVFNNPAPGSSGAARQAVVSYSDPTNKAITITNLRVLYNTFHGPGEPWNPTDENSRGTGDQFSINWARNVQAIGTISNGGGENGVAYSNCENFVVSDHIITGNDGQGLQVSAQGAPCRRGLITSNICGNNGVRQDGQGDVMSQLYIQNGEDITVHGNYLYDTHKPRRAKNGLNVATSRRIDLGTNTIRFADPVGAVPVYVVRSTLREFPVSTPSQLVAAIRDAKPHDGIVLTGEYRLTEPLTIAVDRVALFGEGKATILSTANPIFNVRADSVWLSEFDIVGTGKGTPENRQVGMYSDIGRNGFMDAVNISKTTCCVKLDRLNGSNGKPVERGADSWQIQGGEYRPIGTKAGEGYGVHIAATKNHKLADCRFPGSPGNGRHAWYGSVGVSNCIGDGLIISGYSSSSIAFWSSPGQPPCVNNTIRNCQISNQKVGEDGTGGIEVSGNCAGYTIEGNDIHDVLAHGIIINTQGLTELSDHTIQKNEIRRIGKDGIRLQGTVLIRAVENLIEQVSLAQPGQRACVHIQAWYQSAKKVAARDITISGNDLNDAGAREKVTINPTLPKPTNVVLDGKQLAL